MIDSLRRVVTGNGPDGRSSVVADGAVARRDRLVEMWEVQGAPAKLAGVPDLEPLLPALEPVANGSILRFFQLPPKSMTDRMTAEELAERHRRMYESLQASHVQPDTSRHPGMHRTRTLDYVVCLKGRVRLLLDDGHVDLAPFDTVIQRGTNHAWLNLTEEPALLVGVLLDAEE
jgi:hypothetical protein